MLDLDRFLGLGQDYPIFSGKVTVSFHRTSKVRKLLKDRKNAADFIEKKRKDVLGW